MVTHNLDEAVRANRTDRHQVEEEDGLLISGLLENMEQHNLHVVEFGLPCRPLDVILGETDLGYYAVEEFSSYDNDNNLCQGDILVAVNGVDCRGKTLAQVQKLLHSPCELSVTSFADLNMKKKLPILMGEQGDNTPGPGAGVGGDSGNEGGDEASLAEENQLKEHDENEDNHLADSRTDENDKNKEKKKMETDGVRSPLLDEPKQELYDVLDISSEPKPMSKTMEKKLIRRGEIPPAPEGGWKWRTARFIEDKEEEEDIIWTFEFLDENGQGEGEKTEICMTVDGDMVEPLESMTKREMFHEWKVGPIDCLDFYNSKRTGKRLKKWRKSEIIAVAPYYVRVHYTGWSELYDEWIHVIQRKYRLAPFKQETERALRELKAREKKFKENMEKENKMTVVKMDGDGNCLFRTVAHQVYGTPSKHRLVRKECCNYMLKNKKRFELFVLPSSVKGYVRTMRKNGVWGSDPEIRAMEELYDRPMEMYRCEGNGSNVKPSQIHFIGDLPLEQLKDVEPIRLSFHGRCHYNSIMKLSAAEKMNKKTFAWKPPPRRKDGVIISHRQKMLEDALEEEKKRIEAAKKEKEKKKKEEQDSGDEDEEKTNEGEEKADTGAPDATDAESNVDVANETEADDEAEADTEAEEPAAENPPTERELQENPGEVLKTEKKIEIEA